MYRAFLSVFLAGKLAATLRVSPEPPQSLSHRPESTARLAHIYVMNLKERRDRCECMRSQLKSSLFTVSRHEAVSKASLNEQCPDAPLNKTWAAIFCSNRQIISKALASPNKPKYIIIMEDDLAFEPQFFTKLHSLLSNECLESSHWDRMVVDTFDTLWTLDPKKQLHSLKRQHIQCNDQEGSESHPELSKLYHANKDSYGAHVQIIKSSALESMINSGFQTMDHWDKFKNVTTIFWQPKLVKQIGKWQHGQAPTECDQKSIEKSDHHGGSKWFNFKDKESGSDSDAMFACPAV